MNKCSMHPCLSFLCTVLPFPCDPPPPSSLACVDDESYSYLNNFPCGNSALDVCKIDKEAAEKSCAVRNGLSD